MADGSVASNDGTLFNPSEASFRFSPFGSPRTPVFCAGLTPEAAVYEGTLHDAIPGGVVLPSAWQSKVLSALTTTRPLNLAQFYGTGLGQYGLTAMNLTDTDALHYPLTAQWAEAAWTEGFDGIQYVARHSSPDLAVVLFDRTPSAPPCVTAVTGHPENRIFALPHDAAWLRGLATRPGCQNPHDHLRYASGCAGVSDASSMREAVEAWGR